MNGGPPRVHLVQLAGGKGSRVGGERPKQFLESGRGLLFRVSLAEFLKLPAEIGQVASLTVTAAEQWADVVKENLEQLAPSGCGFHRADPGSTRTESTWSALRILAARELPAPNDLVAVHDAARPFATVRLLEELIRAAFRFGAAVPGIPVSDTILQTAPDPSAAEYLQRETLVAVQTPQVFRWDLLHSAHRWAAENGKNFTDDGSLVSHCGTSPRVVPGEQTNWKVTTEGDWQRAAGLLAE
jgi:2-C-methyl-D-erythritol 4-phosphate cytidylyltransferase / 2-C-methyl-D-erythritol 2,4-cyclodiphosphate synthase